MTAAPDPGAVAVEDAARSTDPAAVDSPSGYRAGARAAVPYIVPTLLLGVSFGAFARSAGWGLVEPIVMSSVVVSASAQFATVAVLASGGTALTAVIAAGLANSRFIPMGTAVAPSLKGGPLRRAVEGQAVIDAAWALANRDGRFDREVLLGASAPQIAAWVGGSAIGSAMGAALGGPETLGLDAVLPAFLLSLLVTELRLPRQRSVALLAAVITLALIPVLPAGVPVLVASGAIVIGLRKR
jgi:4-azaleucine resistance transporter AzlC